MVVLRVSVLLTAASIFFATEAFAAEGISEVRPNGDILTEEAESDEELLIHALSELKRWRTQVEVLSNKLAAKDKILRKQNAAAAEQIKIHKAAAEQNRNDAAPAEQSKSSASSDKLTDDIVARTGIPPNICASGGIPLAPKLSYVKDLKQIQWRVTNRLPLTITDSKIVDPALKWDHHYLAKHSKKTWRNTRDRGIAKGVDLPISLAAYFSKSLEFMYVRPGSKKLANPAHYVWQSRTNWSYLDFTEIKHKLDDADREDFFYVQTLMSKYPGVPFHESRKFGPVLDEDISNFAWDVPANVSSTLWQNTPNKGRGVYGTIVWIGQRGTVTPMHIDYQPGLLAQAQGSKCILLLENDDNNWKKMQAYPLEHPHRRQSQTLHAWNNVTQKFDLNKLPEGLTGLYVTHIDPGEATFVPSGMWHAVASIREDITSKTEFGLSFAFTHTTESHGPYGTDLRLKAAIQCEQDVYGKHGAKYGRLFRDLDMKLSNEPELPGTTIKDMNNALAEITKICGNVIAPVLNSGESMEDFLDIYYQGRFKHLQLEEDWNHVESFGKYLARVGWWDSHARPNKPSKSKPSKQRSRTKRKRKRR